MLMTALSDNTRAGAWLKAAEVLSKKNERAYNLIVEIREPGLATSMSRAVEKQVDGFLKKYDCQPLHTVAETIFPATEYRSGGLDAVLEYPRSVYPFIRSLPANRRGTYALRLTERKCSDGTVFVPLEAVITKLKKQLKLVSPKRAVYEIDLGCEPLELKFYDYEKDNANIRAGQCLSHISLKLGPDRELYMTAMYRYQFFLQKALGNFLGLARLQSCVASELNLQVGPLVCHATMAVLDSKQYDQKLAWNRDGAIGLLADCRKLMPINETDQIAA